MSDLFHTDVPDDYIVAVAKVMEMASWHTFQVLTKRSERLRELLGGKLKFASKLKNVWWGVSVEDKKYGVPRISDLRAAAARTRFLSIEPLLEDIGMLDLRGLSWVIVGGESGHGARPMERTWVLSLRDQCARAGVRFFFKQWGGVQKSRHGRELDGATYDEMPAPEHGLPLDESLRTQRLRRAEALAMGFDVATTSSRARLPVLDG